MVIETHIIKPLYRLLSSAASDLIDTMWSQQEDWSPTFLSKALAIEQEFLQASVSPLFQFLLHLQSLSSYNLDPYVKVYLWEPALLYTISWANFCFFPTKAMSGTILITSLRKWSSNADNFSDT